MANRDAELYAPYKTAKAASSTNSSSCNSSPTSRCETFQSFILDHLCDLLFRLSIFLNMDSLQIHSSPIKREDRGDLRDLVWSADNIRK